MPAPERVRFDNGAPPRAQLEDIQRARLLAATVAAISELGLDSATVGRIAGRAHVSRRTFYELFANRDDCLAAVLDDVVARVEREFAEAGVAGLPWRVRVRTGMALILTFLDHEPELAQVCVVQASRAGAPIQERRERVLARLAAVVDQGRGAGARGEGCTKLTAEGLVGAAFAIVYARLLRGEREPLTDLRSELMGMIVLPYLGLAAVRREHMRPEPDVGRGVERDSARIGRPAEDPLDGVRMRFTYRTIRVLEGIAQLGGRGSGPSNRMVADYAGIADPGQVSKLLARLERVGLVANGGGGHAKGEPNAWSLSAKGRTVAQSLHVHTPAREAA